MENEFLNLDCLTDKDAYDLMIAKIVMAGWKPDSKLSKKDKLFITKKFCKEYGFDKTITMYVDRTLIEDSLEYKCEKEFNKAFVEYFQDKYLDKYFDDVSTDLLVEYEQVLLRYGESFNENY